MLGAVIFAAVAIVCWFAGWRFTLWLFKKKEVGIPRKPKLALEIGSGVLLAGIAIAFALLFVKGGIMDPFGALRSELVLCALLFAGLIDFKLMIIPNKLTLVLLGASVLTYIAEFILFPNAIAIVAAEALLGCAVCFIIFFIGRLISRRGMGMGDIKLASVMGLSLGMNNALGCLFWAEILAAITGIILIATKKKKTKSKIAMAPFFFAGVTAGHIMLLAGGAL